MISPMIRAATLDDAPAIAALYNPYITDTDISFESEPLSDDTMAARMQGIMAKYPWRVFESEGTLLGYAYATQWKAREAYRFCAETCIYIRRDQPGKGIGSALYTDLLAQLADSEVRIAIGCIALPNDASVALHEKFGYQKVAHFPAVGHKFNRWIDVGYWQKHL